MALVCMLLYNLSIPISVNIYITNMINNSIFHIEVFALFRSFCKPVSSGYIADI